MTKAKVVCRELGCVNTIAASRGPPVEERRGGVKLLSCRGEESSLRACDIRGGPGVYDGRYYGHVIGSGKKLVVL